jgi:hypothetical protein
VTRAPAVAPNIPWPPVKGDITICGDRATGRKAKCVNCRHDILEVERWHPGFHPDYNDGKYAMVPTGRFAWIHYEPQTACLRAKR